MSEFRKIFGGQRVREWPAQSWNKLLRGEERDRAKTAPTPAPVGQHHSPVFARLRWEGTTPIPPGSVVKLGPSLFDPDPDAGEIGASYALIFKATPFAAEDGQGAPYALTLGPFAPADEDAGEWDVGWGVIPEAWWALVDISDEDHAKAKVPPSGTTLASATSGLDILHKPAGTGVKWCVVQLAGGGGATGAIRTATLSGTIAAGSAATPTEGQASAVYSVATGGETELEDENVTVWNPFAVEATGSCTVNLIGANDEGENEYLITGINALAALECDTLTVVTAVDCVDDELDITDEEITIVTGPCP